MLSKWYAAAMLAAVMFVAGGLTEAHAQKGNLVRMTEQQGTLKDGKLVIDTMKVRGTFGELRLYNRGAPLMIDNVRVIYSDGTSHDERRTIDLRKGERTKPIDPKKDGKFVDEVIVTYKAGDGAKGAVALQLYGQQDSKGARAKRPTKSEPAKPVAAAPAGKPVGNGAAGPGPAPAVAKPVAAAPAAPAAPAASAAAEKRVVATTKAPEGRCVGEGNVLLTRANVGLGNDRDRLAVANNLGKFERIRICISGVDIDLQTIKVAFAGGESMELPYAGTIKAGHRTEPMSLKGDKFIDGIDITYRRKEQVGAIAGVEIWGELSEKWIDQESELFNDGWVRLTTGNTVGFVGFETDRSPVRAHKRGFKKVRVVVKDRDITLDYLDLIYADGSSQKIAGDRKKIEPEVGFGPIDIKDGPKVIKEVEARYRSRFFDKDAKGSDKATVEVWGKR